MNSRHERFVEELLSQMPQLTSEQYRGYRRELDERLARARREEKAMRWIVIGAWTAAVAFYIGAVCLSFVFESREPGRFPDWLVFSLAATALLLPVGALLLLGLYLFKYRRSVNRAHGKAREAALGELQRQLNELRAELLPSRKDDPTTSNP